MDELLQLDPATCWSRRLVLLFRASRVNFSHVRWKSSLAPLAAGFCLSRVWAQLALAQRAPGRRCWPVRPLSACYRVVQPEGAFGLLARDREFSPRAPTELTRCQLSRFNSQVFHNFEQLSPAACLSLLHPLQAPPLISLDFGASTRYCCVRSHRICMNLWAAESVAGSWRQPVAWETLCRQRLLRGANWLDSRRQRSTSGVLVIDPRRSRQ